MIALPMSPMSSADISLCAWLKLLRISDADVAEYVSSLINLGFDDVQSLVEDVEESDLLQVAMKPGHLRRVLKQIQRDRLSKRLPISTSLASNLASREDISRVIRCKRCQVACIDELGNQQIIWIEPGFCGDVSISELPLSTGSGSLNSGSIHTPFTQIPFTSPINSVDMLEPVMGSMESTEEKPSFTLNNSTEILENSQKKLNADPLKWSIEDVLQWLKRFESLGDEKYLKSFKENGINGNCLLGITSEADAEGLGIIVRSHKLRLLKEVTVLRDRSRDINMDSGRGSDSSWEGHREIGDALMDMRSNEPSDHVWGHRMQEDLTWKRDYSEEDLKTGVRTDENMAIHYDDQDEDGIQNDSAFSNTTGLNKYVPPRRRRMTDLMLPLPLDGGSTSVNMGIIESTPSSSLSASLPHTFKVGSEASEGDRPTPPSSMSPPVFPQRTPSQTPRGSSWTPSHGGKHVFQEGTPSRRSGSSKMRWGGKYASNAEGFNRIRVLANEITPKVNPAHGGKMTSLRKEYMGPSHIRQVQRIREGVFFDAGSSPDLSVVSGQMKNDVQVAAIQLDELPIEARGESPELQSLQLQHLDISDYPEDSGDFSIGGTLRLGDFILKPQGMIANNPGSGSGGSLGDFSQPKSISTASVGTVPSSKDSLDRTPTGSSRVSRGSRTRENETTILLEEVGRGGGGTVYKAFHIPSLRLVAVKVVNVSEDTPFISHGGAKPGSKSAIGNRQQIARELKALHSINLVLLEGNSTPRKNLMTPLASESVTKSKWDFNMVPNRVNSGHSSEQDISDTEFPLLSSKSAKPSRSSFSGAINSTSTPKLPQDLSKSGLKDVSAGSDKTSGAGEKSSRRSAGVNSLGSSTRSLSTGKSECDRFLTSNKPCSYIVAFHDAYTDPIKSTVCMMMEYMDAGTLQQFVKSRKKADEYTLAAVARSVLKGLAAMHAQHRIHRDIKPSNILLDRKGRVKIGDFGVTKELGLSTSLASTFTGTLSYMSPERINNKSYDYSSDIWSIGLVIVTLALGNFPLETENGSYWAVFQAIQEGPPPVLPPNEFPSDLCEFVTSMLRREPEERLSAIQLLKHPFLKRLKEARRATRLIPPRSPCDPEKAEALMEEVLLYRMHQRIMEINSNTRDRSSSPLTIDREPLNLPPLKTGDVLVLSKQLSVPAQVLVDAYQRFAKMAEDDWLRGALENVGKTMSNFDRSFRHSSHIQNRGKIS